MLKAGNIKRLLAAIAVVVVLGISSAVGYCAEDEFKIVKTYPENAAGVWRIKTCPLKYGLTVILNRKTV